MILWYIGMFVTDTDADLQIQKYNFSLESWDFSSENLFETNNNFWKMVYSYFHFLKKSAEFYNWFYRETKLHYHDTVKK